MRYWIIALLLAANAYAADWFCRTPVLNPANNAPMAGIYGAQNGTSYADAWNGVGTITWGGGGVTAGDTLWICGPYLYRSALNDFSYTLISIGASGTAGSPITIRMDYPTDPGEFFGFWEDRRRPWEGPDVNGVYMQRNAYGEPGGVTFVYPTFYETLGPPSTGSTVYILTNKGTASTWVDGVNGASEVIDGNYRTNFALPIAVNITSNLFSRENGYRFNLGTRSNIVFNGCRFTGSYVTATRNGDGSLSANHITFTNCVWAYWYRQDLYPGFDDWTFDHCTFHDMSNGIYTWLDGKTIGADRLTVRDCTITQMGWGREAGDGFFHDNDSHAIGIQGGNGHIIEHNTTSRTGDAIEFWTADQKMTNNTVRWNFVKDVVVSVGGGTQGHGIVVSGSNDYADPGTRTGFKIYGNVIMNMAIANQTDLHQGAGISSNNRDPIECYNNVISNAVLGLKMEISGAYPATGVFKNNTIVASRSYALRVTGTGATTLDSDYNCFWPEANSSANVSLSPAFAHDANSVYSNPLFTSLAPATALDFRLLPASPARGAGTPWSDWTLDYLGNPTLNPPSIGAFDSNGRWIIAPTVRATLLRIGTP